MQRTARQPIAELNEFLTCKLCKGYFVHATTIIECLHTFCRSCIVRYLESNKYCPVCDVQVHKTKPLLNIRPDKTIQDIVYKLVPRLFQNEMQRRNVFYDEHPDKGPTEREEKEEAAYQYLLSPEETISLTLNYHGCVATPRYFRCPAAVSVAHLKKLIRAKYDLTEQHRVEIMYNQKCLTPSLTLTDIAYIYLWKKKEPFELTYRIYERNSKTPKLDTGDTSESLQNNNNWKEVQLRISETGEMSITGIQDSSLLDLVEKDEENRKFQSEVVVTDSKNCPTKPKKELPGLKFIGTPKKSTSKSALNNVVKAIESVVNNANESETSNNNCQIGCPSDTNHGTSSVGGHGNMTCASLSCGTTTTVFSTINNTKCSTKSDDLPNNNIKSDGTNTEFLEKSINNNAKTVKRKNDTENTSEIPQKLPKPTILNHSIGLLNLSNRQSMKKNGKTGRNAKNPAKTLTQTIEEAVNVALDVTKVPDVTVATSMSEETNSKPTVINNSVGCVSSQPCYVPKSCVTSTAKPNGDKPVMGNCDVKSNASKPEVLNSSISIVKSPSPSTTTVSTAHAQQATVQNINNKLVIKTKPSTPIGYKTLRDPPKSWNSQISKANVSKNNTNTKYTDAKGSKPAKFFKGRNMPRYLGNPASGVKPMYQVHVSPDKEKSQEGKTEKSSEIKKHSIVKIDPKTLKPISEKAPETSNLSNLSSLCVNSVSQELKIGSGNDLKINTSSVSIFNPLKLQSSPKNDRKSPKSPHSPKVKNNIGGSVANCISSAGTASTTAPLSPATKRDKLNLNFTPSNPFIPNLASPTLNPNQFLYPSGPPGFPSYDPRVMAAYHSLWYGQRMGFPTPPIPGLNLDMNRKFEVGPASPKVAQSQNSPVISPKPPQVTLTPSIRRSPNLSSPVHQKKQSPKKSKDPNKNDKSLETTVEKLTQNKTKQLNSQNKPPENASNRLETDKKKVEESEKPNERSKNDVETSKNDVEPPEKTNSDVINKRDGHDAEQSKESDQGKPDGTSQVLQIDVRATNVDKSDNKVVDENKHEFVDDGTKRDETSKASDTKDELEAPAEEKSESGSNKIVSSSLSDDVTVTGDGVSV